MPEKRITKVFDAIKGLPEGFKHPEGGWTVCATAEIDPKLERGGDIIRIDGMSWPEEVPLLAQHLHVAADGSPTVIGKARNFRKSEIAFAAKPCKAILADIYFADTELAGKYKSLFPEFINSVSVGAIVNEAEPLDPKHPYEGYDYTKTEGVELSVVTVPANPAAGVLRAITAALGDVIDPAALPQANKNDSALPPLLIENLATFAAELNKINRSVDALRDEWTRAEEQAKSLREHLNTRLDDIESAVVAAKATGARDDQKPGTDKEALAFLRSLDSALSRFRK